jgi:hypothetical protein
VVLYYSFTDAANLDAVIIANQKKFITAKYVRSSVDCLFTNQITAGTTGKSMLF